MVPFSLTFRDLYDFKVTVLL